MHEPAFFKVCLESVHLQEGRHPQCWTEMARSWDDECDLITSGALTLCLIYFQGFTCNDFLQMTTRSQYLYDPNFTDEETDAYKGIGYTLLKVTQLVSSRVKIQIQACSNPDAESFPLLYCRILP